jgi:hypothetical protein
MRRLLAKAVCASLSPLSFAEGLARRLSGPASFRFTLQWSQRLREFATA